MTTGLGRSSSPRSRSALTANPRLGVTRDFIDTIPCTRPCRSRTGPPLLPGSTGIASWSMSMPFICRSPDTRPATTLRSRPCGLPMATISAPAAIASAAASGSGAGPVAAIRTTARSPSRSVAWTAVTSCSVPSASSTLIGRASPMTCRFVATRPAPTKNPVPSPSSPPRRPRKRIVTIAGFAARASSSTDLSAGVAAGVATGLSGGACAKPGSPTSSAARQGRTPARRRCGCWRGKAPTVISGSMLLLLTLICSRRSRFHVTRSCGLCSNQKSPPPLSLGEG